MASKVQVAVGFILACNIVGCHRQTGNSPATPAEVVVSKQRGEGSSRPPEFFVSKDGNFKVSVGGKPAEQKQLTPRGTAIVNFLWERDGKLFFIGYSDHPKVATDTEEGLQKMIDTFLVSYLRTMKAKVTGESRVKVAEQYIGRDFFADNTAIPSRKLRGRMFFVGERMYRLSVVGTKEFVEGEEANRFFNTFEVLK